MNENVKKLGRLADGIDDLLKEHAEILTREAYVQNSLNEANREAHRRYKIVSEHSQKEEPKETSG